MTEPKTCPKCGNKLTRVRASDFDGWSCMDTAGCVYRIKMTGCGIPLFYDDDDWRCGEQPPRGGKLYYCVTCDQETGLEYDPGPENLDDDE